MSDTKPQVHFHLTHFKLMTATSEPHRDTITQTCGGPEEQTHWNTFVNTNTHSSAWLPKVRCAPSNFFPDANICMNVCVCVGVKDLPWVMVSGISDVTTHESRITQTCMCEVCVSGDCSVSPYFFFKCVVATLFVLSASDLFCNYCPSSCLSLVLSCSLRLLLSVLFLTSFVPCLYNIFWSTEW